MAVRAVLGQQITVGAARTLASRIVDHYGHPVPTGIASLNHAFPSPRRILALPGDIESHMGPIGIIRTRARTIRGRRRRPQPHLHHHPLPPRRRPATAA